MQAMTTFMVWFIEQFPRFLLAEPVCYFVAIMLLGYTISAFFTLKRRY